MERGASPKNTGAGCDGLSATIKTKGVCDVVRPTKSKTGPVVKLSVTVSPESGAKLAAYCKKNDRAASWVVDKLIALYVGKLP